MGLLITLYESRPVSLLYLLSLHAVLAHCLFLRDGTSYVGVIL